MANKGDFTKILAWAGTILAWFPILAVILAVILEAILALKAGTAPSGMFRYNYLMGYDYPMFEYLMLASLLGAPLLLWAASRARSRRGLIGWSLLAAPVLLIGGAVLVVMAMGTVMSPSTPESVGMLLWGLGLIGLAGYVVALILICVGGILLLRDLYRQEPTAQAA